jgi:hypothetical protein
MEKTMKKRTEELVESLENILNVAFQASDMSFTDLLLSMDDDMAPILLPAIETYKLSKEYVVEQASMFDNIVERLERLEQRAEKENGLLESVDQALDTGNRKLDRINEVLSKMEREA